MMLSPMHVQPIIVERYAPEQAALPTHGIYARIAPIHTEQVVESTDINLAIQKDESKLKEIRRKFLEETGITLEKVLREPELYAPELLLSAVFPCLEFGDMNTAAELFLAALVRSEILVALSGGRSLGDYTSFFSDRLRSYISSKEWTDAVKEKFQEALENAKKNFDVWDQKHPFSKTFEEIKKWIKEYDAEEEEDEDEEDDELLGEMFRWTDSEREAIVRRTTREIVKGIYHDIEDGEDFLAEASDMYFFDRVERKYTVSTDGDCVTFPVRSGIFPKLDRFGEYCGKIALPSYGMISFGFAYSKGESAEKWLKERYVSTEPGVVESKDIFTDQKFFTETILKGMGEIAGQPSFHTRVVQRMPSGEIISITNTLTFAGKNSTLYDIALTCSNEENEEKGLFDLKEITSGMQFENR